MEAYRGSLSHFCMHLLVPALIARPSLSGRLRVTRGTVTREFLLSEGHVVGQSSTAPGEHLGQVLHSLGLLEAERAAAAFEQAHASGVAFAQYLASHGLLERRAVEDAFRHKAREAFFDCYDWEAGDIAFQPGAVPTQGLLFRLNLEALHREALSIRCEWRTFRTIFPDPHGHFRGDASRLRIGTDDEDLLLTSLAEGGASLAELLQSGRESRLSTARRLITLYRRGALVPRGADGGRSRVASIMAEAEDALADGAFEEAGRLASVALEHGPIPQAHTLLQQAEEGLIRALSAALAGLRKEPTLLPLPSPAPRELTVDDLVLYARLQRGGSVEQTLRDAPMGERGAFHSLSRLVRVGVLRLNGEAGLRS